MGERFAGLTVGMGLLQSAPPLASTAETIESETTAGAGQERLDLGEAGFHVGKKNLPMSDEVRLHIFTQPLGANELVAKEVPAPPSNPRRSAVNEPRAQFEQRTVLRRPTILFHLADVQHPWSKLDRLSGVAVNKRAVARIDLTVYNGKNRTKDRGVTPTLNTLGEDIRLGPPALEGPLKWHNRSVAPSPTQAPDFAFKAQQLFVAGLVLVGKWH